MERHGSSVQMVEEELTKYVVIQPYIFELHISSSFIHFYP